MSARRSAQERLSSGRGLLLSFSLGSEIIPFVTSSERAATQLSVSLCQLSVIFRGF